MRRKGYRTEGADWLPLNGFYRRVFNKQERAVSQRGEVFHAELRFVY